SSRPSRDPEARRPPTGSARKKSPTTLAHAIREQALDGEFDPPPSPQEHANAAPSCGAPLSSSHLGRSAMKEALERLDALMNRLVEADQTGAGIEPLRVANELGKIRQMLAASPSLIRTPGDQRHFRCEACAGHRPRADDVRLAALGLPLLPRIGRLASQLAHERGALSLERARVLWQLTDVPRRSGDLARKCVLTPASLSELVDSRERDGFVRRSEDPSDRRVVVVEMTARGRREIERVGEYMTEPVAQILSTLSAEKRDRLAAALTDLQQALAQPADKAAPHVR